MVMIMIIMIMIIIIIYCFCEGLLLITFSMLNSCGATLMWLIN